jgi:hypothetical protein
MERCWEEARRGGQEITERPGALYEIVSAVAPYFEVPRSPEAEAMHVFLEGVLSTAENFDAARALVRDALARLDEAAQ